MDEIYSMVRGAIINGNVVVPRYRGGVREMCPQVIGTTGVAREFDHLCN
jgi:hypothetical protein